MWAPTTATEAESFLWYRATPKLQLGAAYLWRQGAFRGLANYEVAPETSHLPNLRVGLGLQGIGTGNPGYFATSEKTIVAPHGFWSGYLGVGFRANENHGHMLGGLKFTTLDTLWTVGMQNDGHALHAFASRSMGNGFSVGVYLIEMKSPGIMVSYSVR